MLSQLKPFAKLNKNLESKIGRIKLDLLFTIFGYIGLCFALITGSVKYYREGHIGVLLYFFQ